LGFHYKVPILTTKPPGSDTANHSMAVLSARKVKQHKTPLRPGKDKKGSTVYPACLCTTNPAPPSAKPDIKLELYAGSHILHTAHSTIPFTTNCIFTQSGYN
jgi:hypothetical protein